MGLYCWVEHRCQCGGEIQFQSKSHPSQEWGSIDVGKVPIEVARDIDGEIKTCPDCGKFHEISIDRLAGTIPMKVRSYQ